MELKEVNLYCGKWKFLLHVWASSKICLQTKFKHLLNLFLQSSHQELSGLNDATRMTEAEAGHCE